VFRKRGGRTGNGSQPGQGAEGRGRKGGSKGGSSTSTPPQVWVKSAEGPARKEGAASNNQKGRRREKKKGERSKDKQTGTRFKTSGRKQRREKPTGSRDQKVKKNRLGGRRDARKKNISFFV